MGIIFIFIRKYRNFPVIILYNQYTEKCQDLYLCQDKFAHRFKIYQLICNAVCRKPLLIIFFNARRSTDQIFLSHTFSYSRFTFYHRHAMIITFQNCINQIYLNRSAMRCSSGVNNALNSGVSILVCCRSSAIVGMLRDVPYRYFENTNDVGNVRNRFVLRVNKRSERNMTVI